MKKTIAFISTLAMISFLIILLIPGCSKTGETSTDVKTEDLGIGPITKTQIEPFNQQLSDKGKKIFETKCFACHRTDMKLVGPPIKGATDRHTPEWIMNMMINPQEMTQKNPQAQTLFTQYKVQMLVTGGVTPDEARAVYEYLRSVDGKK